MLHENSPRAASCWQIPRSRSKCEYGSLPILANQQKSGIRGNRFFCLQSFSFKFGESVLQESLSTHISFLYLGLG